MKNCAKNCGLVLTCLAENMSKAPRMGIHRGLAPSKGKYSEASRQSKQTVAQNDGKTHFRNPSDTMVEAKKSWQSFLSDLPPNEVGPFDLKTSTTPDYFQRLFGSSLRLMRLIEFSKYLFLLN
jgi:hypothetical protein